MYDESFYFIIGRVSKVLIHKAKLKQTQDGREGESH